MISLATRHIYPLESTNPIELNPFILYQKNSFFSIGFVRKVFMEKIARLYLLLKAEDIYDEFIKITEELKRKKDYNE